MTVDAADVAVVDATVITMDAAGTIHEAASIIVTDGVITHVGAPLQGIAPARHVIDGRGAIVVPGLVNAHTHLAMTVFRGVADDLDLDHFLARLLPAEAAVLSRDLVAAGSRLGVAECLRGGITTALDMYYFPDATADVAAAAGMRVLGGPVFIDVDGVDGPAGHPFAARVEWAARRLAATPEHERWLCPHSTYLLAEEQLGAIARLAADTGARVHVHACETAIELELVRSRHRRTPIEVLAQSGLLGPQTVLAHAVHVTDADLGLVAASGAAVAHCPASNQKLSSGFARVPEMVAAGVPVALGTDGAASANDLDLWLAMRLAGYSQAALAGVAVLPAATLLRMATIDGARALGLDDRIGSIEVGKRADVVVLDPSSPSLTPSYDPVSTAVYAAGRGDVRWVVTDGRVVVDDRVLVTVDVDRAIADVRALGPSISAAVA